MTAISITNTPGFKIRPMRYARNGSYPHTVLQAQMANEANKLVVYRTKEVARFVQPIGSLAPAAGGSDTTLWRFAFHSGPYTSTLFVKFYSSQPDQDSPGQASATLTIETVTPATVGTATLNQGVYTPSPNNVPSNFRSTQLVLVDGSGVAPIPPDTDLFGTLAVVNQSRILAISVSEGSINPDTDDGFAQTKFALGTPIYDEDRGDVTGLLRDMWKSGSSHLWNYAVQSDANAVTNSTTTAKNVIDNSSTSVTTATPGATLDLTNCSTVRRASAGVPVTFKVYAARTVSNGSVTLRDSGGSAVLTVSITGAAGWYSVTGNLPATKAKYDIWYVAGAAGTCTFYASSLYLYEA